MKLFLPAAPFTLAICALGLSACVSSGLSTHLREDMMAKVFPDPAERQGIHNVTPLASGQPPHALIVDWFPNEIDEWTLKDRLSSACTRISGQPSLAIIRKDFGTRTQTMSSTGERKLMAAASYNCALNRS